MRKSTEPIIITSLKNDFVKHLVKLQQKKYRDEFDEFVVEGPHLLEELSKTDYEYKTIGIESHHDYVITKEIAKKISSTESGYESFALVKKQEFTENLGTRHFILDGIQDPGNLGTIIRTAYSFGFDSIYLSRTCVDHYNDKAIRSSQGSLFHIPVFRRNIKNTIKLMKNNDIKVYATNLDEKSVELNDVRDSKVAVVLGSEGSGVSDGILNLVDKHVVIKTKNFDSLNVGIASGIIAYKLQQ